MIEISEGTILTTPVPEGSVPQYDDHFIVVAVTGNAVGIRQAYLRTEVKPLVWYDKEDILTLYEVQKEGKF